MTAAQVCKQVLDHRLIAVLREDTTEAAVAMGRALLAAGVKVIEVAYTTPGAADVLGELQHAAGSDVVLGAGTIRRRAELEDALGAGAQFVFSPHVDVSLLRAAQQADILAIPGVMTPTEVATALGAGTPLVKLFPATSLGPGYLGSLRGPCPELRAITTGGLTVENVDGWMAAGADAVGVSGAFERAWSRGGAEAVARTARGFLSALKDGPGTAHAEGNGFYSVRTPNT